MTLQEILESVKSGSVSADMRFERVASTSGVRTHRKNERFSFAADTPILIFGEAPNP